MTLSYGKKRRSRKKSRKLQKLTKKGLEAVVYDPVEGIIDVQGKLIQLPRSMLRSIRDTTGNALNRTKKIKILDPAEGVLSIAGETVKVPFDFADSLLEILTLKKSKMGKSRKKRKPSKPSKLSKPSKKKSKKKK